MMALHDKESFNAPEGWRTKDVSESPHLTEFSALWKNLRTTYQNELTQLAFVTIPEEKEFFPIF